MIRTVRATPPDRLPACNSRQRLQVQAPREASRLRRGLRRRLSCRWQRSLCHRSALLDGVEIAAGGVGGRRITPVTTNDNVEAIRLYAVATETAAALGGPMVDLLSNLPAFFAEKSGGAGAPGGVAKTGP